MSEFAAGHSGLYESIVTDELLTRIAQQGALVPSIRDVDEADAPDILARYVANIALRHLREVEHTDRAAFVNRLVAQMQDGGRVEGEQPRQLMELSSPVARALPRPSTPLSDAALLTNARDEPSLGAELRAELASADSVDLLCAFIKWHGIRTIEDALAQIKDRGVRFRIITTTYIGATERRALDVLSEKYGAEIKVSFETQSTRLHAKAWLFRRNSGFDTAYVGSSNLSHAALVDGLEWNVRLSRVGTASLLRKFEATFDSYWNDEAFESYVPARDGERLDRALQRSGTYEKGEVFDLSGLQVRPYPYQATMLESLEAEREVHGRHRNLIIAATGTGKTIVAALDYQNLIEKAGARLRLLFVAHREEILRQSMRAYREVLMEGDFGELMVGGRIPEDWTHVFASVQSLHSYGVQNLEAGRFDVVVIDEFHHAEAATYRRLIDYLKPKELLGLTATPERGDGVNVKQAFFDGRAAAELRLWDAMEANILVPFHYFGVADDTDLTAVDWKRGGYTNTGLDAVYTGNDARAAKVLRTLRDKVSRLDTMRAVGFCVSVRHAEYMTQKFNLAGVKAVTVTGSTPTSERSQALRDLRSGAIQCIFSVDVFNEGLDLPQIDTILMLRPTQSATIFQQQLGRGLRRAHGKAVLTVLDFIGHHRKEFNLEARYRTLTGIGRSKLVKQVEQGFPFLPSGSQIVLDRVARQVVLENIRTQLKLSENRLVADIRQHAESSGQGTYSLSEYLEDSGQNIREIYRRHTWTVLSRKAGLSTPLVDGAEADEEESVLKRTSAFLHVDDPDRADAYMRLASKNGLSYRDLAGKDKHYARMLVGLLWPTGNGFASYDEALSHLRSIPAMRDEIEAVVSVGVDASRRLPRPLGDGLDDIPLYTHATYRREEILAALGYAYLDQNRHVGNHREGVAWCKESDTDALLITLNKSEALFSPNTMYRDYALSSSLFHWESQNATSVASPTGQRYLDRTAHGSHVVLFSRHSSKDEYGLTSAYSCLGPADYVEHNGERPIAITWRLQREMPADVYVSASAVAR